MIFSGSGTANVGSLSISASQELTLKLQDSTTLGGVLNIANGILNIVFDSSDATLSTALSPTGGTTNIKVLQGKSGTISESLTKGNGAINLSLENNSSLALKSNTNTISNLSGNGTIDLAMADLNANPISRSVKARSGFKTLSISGDYSGSNTFHLYVDPKSTNGTKSDQITINGSGNKSGTAIFTITGNYDDLMAISYEQGGSDNVQIASGMQGILVYGGESAIGYDLIKAQVINDGGNVYLGKAIVEGVLPEVQAVASSALTFNYDLFLANFNSLNKRMGELRANANSQGLWARVFGGNTSNDFGVGSKTNYVTAQAGYDYSFSVGENAKNYSGVAVAYGKSWTKANDGVGLGRATLSNVDSQMVEVGVYNSYVADSGWYNDTILKFDYIMSDFTLQAGSVTADNSTNNFAMILSDEFGYRYEFGVSEKGSWYIDPQAEVAFGYFNQSDFNQALSKSGRTVLEASQDSILTLRSRAGLSLGKKFVTEKGFASIYVGASYEYDYIEGGDSSAGRVGGTVTQLDKIESDGRSIVNVGSNIGLNENARLYIDVEKSFGDKQRTFMQFNFGARYSF